jgi:hypothetical protein
MPCRTCVRRAAARLVVGQRGKPLEIRVRNVVVSLMRYRSPLPSAGSEVGSRPRRSRSRTCGRHRPRGPHHGIEERFAQNAGCYFGRKIGYWRRSQFCWTGGEGVSQSPLKGKAFSTFLGQKPPFELRRKLAFRLQSFHEIHRGSSNWTNPSISVGGGQQDWLAFALRRQRSHVRIVSGAPTTLRRDFDYLLTI